MRKKIKQLVLTIFTIFACIVMTNANTKAASVTISPSKTNYTINNGKSMYRYIESNGTYQNLYCLDYGGKLNEGSTYEISSDIYNLTDAQITEIFGNVENYNKALWVIDNMFIDQNQSKDEMIIMVNQLKQALHSDIAVNAVREKYNVPNFTQSDFDYVINHVYTNSWYDVFYSVQQCVLWNYTVNTTGFSGLTNLSSGIDLSGKYYMWMYTGLKAVADTKYNYNSPNKNANVENTLNNLTMDDKLATIDVLNKKIGPFIVNGYNNDIITKKDYIIKINGKQLDSTEYSISFDGKNLYITIENSNYDLSAVRVDVSMNIIGVKTTGNLIYRKNSQDVINLYKRTVPKKLTGSTEDTEFDLRLIKNIESVWNTNGLKYDINNELLKTRKIQRVPSLSNGSKTEIWMLNKYPITVSTGDIVKYAITIVNEGSLDGYATKVTEDELINLGILDVND